MEELAGLEELEGHTLSENLERCSIALQGRELDCHSDFGHLRKLKSPCIALDLVAQLSGGSVIVIF